MQFLTTQERLLIGFVITAVLAGALVQFLRDRTKWGEETGADAKIADERRVDWE
ncbi:MAG: hypothetical protein AAGD22_16855 [Verrucomicrobiota bacterium]